MSDRYRNAVLINSNNIRSLVDLLRKYGFVDVPNPNNIAEISGESVVAKCTAADDNGKDEKVEFLLEQDGLEE